MKKSLKIFLAVLVSILVIGTMVSSIICTHYFHLNFKALWWSWILIIFISDIVFGLYIFYNSNRTDETKAFWLFVIVFLPIIGWCFFLIFGWKKQSYFKKSDNNHARLLHAIFSAKKSIKIFSDSFYPSYDVFNALNFATYKDVKVEILLSTRPSEFKQEYLEYKLEQLFDKHVNLYFNNLNVEHSFIIIDDKEVIVCPHNFNFKYMYTNDEFKYLSESDSSLKTWNSWLLRSSQFEFKKPKYSAFKKLKFSIINIFYSFL